MKDLVLEKISDSEKPYSETDLRTLENKFEELYEYVSNLQLGEQANNLLHIIDSYRGFFTPHEEVYNVAALKKVFADADIAPFLKQGNVVDFLVRYQGIDEGFIYELDEDEINQLRSYAELQNTSEKYESLSQIGIENKKFLLKLKFSILNEMQSFQEQGQQDSLEYEFLENDMVTPKIMMDALEAWTANNTLADFSESDLVSIEQFASRDAEATSRFSALTMPKTIDNQDSLEDVPVFNTSQEMVTELLKNPPIKTIEGLPENELQTFLSTREAYLLIMVEHYRNNKPSVHSVDLQAAREQYFVSMEPIVDAVQNIEASGGEKQKSLTTLFLDETFNFMELRALAEKERTETQKENREKIKKSLLSRTGRFVMVGLASLAAQMLDVPNRSGERNPALETSSPTDSQKNIITIEKFDEQTSELEPVYAIPGEGANQLFLNFLTYAEQENNPVYDRLVQVGESANQAAMRLSQETGFWSLGDGENNSAVLYEGDYLSVDAQGELQFTRDGQTHALTDERGLVKQEWLTF